MLVVVSAFSETVDEKEAERTRDCDNPGRIVFCAGFFKEAFSQ